MLRIQVLGHQGDGKTSIAMFIERALKDAGFHVVNNDPDKAFGTDDPDLQPQRLAAMVDRSRAEHVVIDVIPLQRSDVAP